MLSLPCGQERKDSQIHSYGKTRVKFGIDISQTITFYCKSGEQTGIAMACVLDRVRNRRHEWYWYSYKCTTLKGMDRDKKDRLMGL